ncbi:hypothetical protein [Actinopolymorpha rutila]|uniref:Uncharacterized protein n=1 Tax=Actinopolymorpha rutila TaxID=446787 RepID=A0A852ZJP4_9ACTN|nr:hypothetical protein [Actinopolymorpha rutila]NYH88566.1 hypothetical protein [Actinopolymorpha rutila]
MVAMSRGLMPHQRHDLDRLAYEPPAHQANAQFREWTRVSDQARRERAAALASNARWVASGQYAGWTEALRDAADVILWLDPSAPAATVGVLQHAIVWRWRGSRDWDLRSMVQAARGAWSYPSRPQATAEELRERDEANGARTLEVFLSPVSNKVIRCRSLKEVVETIERLSGRSRAT